MLTFSEAKSNKIPRVGTDNNGSMSLVCFGFNHLSAPLEVLEKVSLSEGQMPAVLQKLVDHEVIQEIAGLSTCNRTEFYFVASDAASGREVVLEALQSSVAVDGFIPGVHTYTHRNDQAARHLFRVASGVDSLIIGEAQILGQLRRSYEIALEAGSCGGMLNSLMMRAISFGRKVRTRTNIGKGNVSVASLAAKTSMKALENLDGKRLLIIGAGETARLATRHFFTLGTPELMVVNRTQKNAQAMLDEFGGCYFPIEAMQSAMEQADIIVCAVGAPHYVITRGGVEGLALDQRESPLVLIDLSMPRNIDPDLAALDNVELIALDDLEEIAEDNRQQRMSEISQVETLIEEETDTFIRWTQNIDTTRLVNALRQQVEEIRSQHIKKYCKQMDEEEKGQMERFTDSLLRSVLHNVTANVRSIDTSNEEGRQQYHLVCKLFNIPPETLGEEP